GQDHGPVSHPLCGRATAVGAALLEQTSRLLGSDGNSEHHAFPPPGSLRVCRGCQPDAREAKRKRRPAETGKRHLPAGASLWQRSEQLLRGRLAAVKMAISTSISRLAAYYKRHGFGATMRRAALAVERGLFSNRMVVFYC